MNRIATTRVVQSILLLLVFLVGASVTLAQTSPFKYQGRLTDGGGPATGAYDLQFRLYDALSAGTQIGATVTLEDVAVSTGTFTVTLDFGAAAFPGANRWLEIDVRPGASTGAYTTLTPRQQITSTPYAVQSLNAVNAANAINATNATNATNAASADSLSAACIGCVTGAKIAAGQAVKSLNGLFDNVTLTAGSNITITPSGNTLTLSGSSSGNNWSLTGNTGTTPSLNFLGTSDNQPLAFKINGAEVMRLNTGGNVGIGTTNPAGLLHVRGASPVRILGDVATLAGAEYVDFMARNSPFSTDMGGMRIQRQVSTGDVDTLFFSAASGSSMSEVMRVKGNGNVGIGTTAPGYLLDVANRMRVRQAGGNTAGIWFYQTTPANDRAFVGMVDDTHVGFFGNTGAGFGLTMNTTNGGVDIGTTGPSSAALNVSASVATDFGVLVNTASNNSIAVYGISPNIGVLGRIGLGSGIAGVPFTRTGVWGDTLSGDAVLGTSSTRSGVVGVSETGTGVVGGSTSGYGISGSTGSTGFNVAGVIGEATASSGQVVGVYGKALGSPVGTGVAGFGSAVGGYFQATAPGGTSLIAAGTAQVNVLRIMGGSDLAEHFAVVAVAKPGLVVAIDPGHPGQLSIARNAYNRRVAGVISGANKLEAGMVLPDLPGSKNSLPVALSGRVWVYCDATRSPIQPGDLLTTSNTPGHAMKVTNHAKAQGAIIGKAMTGLKSGRGLVLVLVTLQ